MDPERLVETLSDLALYELDPTGKVRGWSEAASCLLGYSSNEIIGRSAQDLTGQAEGSEGAIEIARREGRVEAFGWMVRNDGSRFWANELTMSIRDSLGQVTGYARIVRDVTSWKTAEEERDRMFSLSRDMICVAGFDGYFKRVNPSFSRILGYTDAELLGQPFLSFVHPDDVAATISESGSLAEGELLATQSFQNRYRCADGSYRWLDWRSHPIVTDRLIYAIARDITAQKVAEQKLQEYSKELERSNGELQTFAYVASHDLQEPLRAVAGCVQMLSERNLGKLDDKSLELIGYAVDGAKRMQTLINDLLAYSRVGSKGISKSLIDPAVAIQTALRQLQAAITESNAVITIDPLPHVLADPVQMTQLFQNLIGNAIKFRGDAPPEIRVYADQNIGEIIFSVHDNGIGIAPEYHERLFGVFQRLNSRREYSGSGIGLAICKKIVERHGGEIWIESKLGEGTNLRFSIPAEAKL